MHVTSESLQCSFAVFSLLGIVWRLILHFQTHNYTSTTKFIIDFSENIVKLWRKTHSKIVKNVCSFCVLEKEFQSFCRFHVNRITKREFFFSLSLYLLNENVITHLSCCMTFRRWNELISETKTCMQCMDSYIII